jgi:hypothetical protein
MKKFILAALAATLLLTPLTAPIPAHAADLTAILEAGGYDTTKYVTGEYGSFVQVSKKNADGFQCH